MQETLTILFTDAVASTEALARLGDERFEQVQAAHLDLLRAPIESGQGREIKSLGDGLMVSFSGAADALACAVAMQQAIEAAGRQGEEGLPLRVGVSAGDVSIDEDDDLHGTAVVEEARLVRRRAAARCSGPRLSGVTSAVALASRVFAIYYLLQAYIAGRLAWRAKKWGWVAFFVALGLAMAAIAVFGIPS